MPTVTFIWKAEANACKKCLLLNGYTWTFPLGNGAVIPQQLIHPILGAVCDASLGSLAHGGSGHNCRCTLEVSFDFSDLQQQIAEIPQILNQLSSEVIKQ